MKTQPKHTPGPWEIHLSDDKISYAIIGRDPTLLDYSNPTDDATVICTDVFCDENARLIAAAPKMMALLERIDADWTSYFPAGPDHVDEIVNPADEHREIWRDIRATLAEIKGE